jgi:hypothetical protein
MKANDQEPFSLIRQKGFFGPPSLEAEHPTAIFYDLVSPVSSSGGRADCM